MGILVITFPFFFFSSIQFVTRSWYLLFPIYSSFPYLNSGSRGITVLSVGFSGLLMLDIHFNSDFLFVFSVIVNIVCSANFPVDPSYFLIMFFQCDRYTITQLLDPHSYFNMGIQDGEKYSNYMLAIH